jgi:hypothetical protein
MLVWHDSLGYRSLAFLAATYPTFTGTPVVGQAHERAAAKSVGQSGSITSPVVSPAQTSCTTGFLMKLAGLNVAGTSTLLEFRALGSVQVLVKVRPATDGFYLQFEKGIGLDILLRTSKLPINTWVFLEVQVTFSQSQGKIVVRADGQEVSRAEGLDTEAGITDNGWDQVRLGLAHAGTTPRFADFYICDDRLDHGKTFTTFLGKVTHASLFTGTAKTRQWSHSLVPANPTAKHRLVVFAGQSNFGGRISSTSSSRWRNPNTKIQIWDRLSGSPAWRSMSATVNTSGMYGLSLGFAGPEMRFAERLAAFYEATSDPAIPNTKIVKGTQDGSMLFPTTGDMCWNPNVSNNLWSGPPSPPSRGCLYNDIIAAVTALGGWSTIERVDFFWLQGESDAIWTIATAAYRDTLTYFFSRVVFDLPAPVKFHVVRLHPQLYTGTAPDSLGFYYRDVIRSIQWDAPNFIANCVRIDQDTCQISIGDYTHLTELGYDTLGDLCFESWLQAQDFSGYVSDYSTLSATDERWIGTTVSAKTISFPAEGLHDANNSPVLAVAESAHASRDFASFGMVASAAGRTLPSIAPVSGSWVAFRQFAAGLDLPEVLTSDLQLVTL